MKYISKIYKLIIILSITLLSSNGVFGQSQPYKIFNSTGTGKSPGPSANSVDAGLGGAVSYLNGIYTWTVPLTGIYQIEAAGAAAGSVTYRSLSLGGRGMIIRGDVYLEKNDLIKIIAGQKSNNASGPSFNAAGGGGGSFVVKNQNIPLFIAGGGGGDGDWSGSGLKNGTDAYSNTAGRQSFQGAPGGISGGGGKSNKNSVTTSSNNYDSGAGGGFYGGGENGSGGISNVGTTNEGGGGQSFNDGLYGGNVSSSFSAQSTDGGFGGGGGASPISGGGGGGYSGGGGGFSTVNTDTDGGGGGGSYIINSANNLSTSNGNYNGSSSGIINLSSYNTLNGYIKITQLYTGGEIVLNGTSSSTHTFLDANYDPVFSSISAAIGGSTPYSYQWQVSTDGVYYDDISGANSLDFNPSAVSQTTFYRRKVTDNSSAIQYSNVIELHKMTIETFTIVESGTKYTVVLYKGDGDSSFTVPSGVASISYLVVGAGGGSGTVYDDSSSGGGGGGQLKTGLLSVSLGENYKLTVGTGGIGGQGQRTPSVITNWGTDGANSSFHSFIALGGEGSKNGRASSSATGGSAATSSTASSAGLSGGTGISGGGGGGSSGNGSTGIGGNNGGGNRGAGTSINITGSSLIYGNGGRGGHDGDDAGDTPTQSTGDGGSGVGAVNTNYKGGIDGANGISIVKYETPCTDPSLTISSTLTVNYRANFTLSPSSTSTGTITYTSSNPSVASVNSSTGAVNALSVGTTTISLSQAVQGDYCADTATMVLIVAKKPITVNGITANDKEYDSNTSVVLNTDNLSDNGGIINGDNVTSTFTGTFSNEHVGTGITVNLTGASTGAEVGNYSITYQLTTTASITKKNLTISGVTASDKGYDGNTTATVDKSNMDLSEVISGDDLTIANTTVTGAFSTAGIGNTKTVNLTYTYAGSDYLNYNITPQSTTQASITAPTYNFTNAGAIGDSGPTQAQINSSYTSGPLNGNVTVTNGIQYWQVPRTSTYRIEAAGAKGGNGGGNTGGSGVKMRGDVQLNAGDVIKILVGQMGANGNSVSSRSAGSGGGGSFVTKEGATSSFSDDIALLVAGGGGGTAISDLSQKHAVTSVQAQSILGYNNGGGTGGNNGQGGGTKSSNSGQAGGGFLSNGKQGWRGLSTQGPGFGYINGGKGGKTSTSAYPGGFGGGGSAYTAGGGGGYSGGAGGAYTSGWNSVTSGGGAGSYIISSASNKANTDGKYNGFSSGIINLSSFNTSHGYVTITPLFSGGQVDLASNSSDLEQFCSATIDPNILNVFEAAGGDTPFTYQWEESTDGNTWSVISGANSNAYDPASINTTKYFRRKVTDAGGAEAYSNEILLEKFEITTQPSISDQFLAPGGSVTSLTVSHTTISNGATYQWYKNSLKSNTGGTLITGATATSYTPNNSTASKNYYYVVISNGTCSISSNVSGLVNIGNPISEVPGASGAWSPMMSGNNFDPNDDQQAVSDTDIVGNANNTLLQTQRDGYFFSSGQPTDYVYYFRARHGDAHSSGKLGSSFYLGLDINGDEIADVFVEANVKGEQGKNPFVSFHKADMTKGNDGVGPSSTAWLNSSKDINVERKLTSRDGSIQAYDVVNGQYSTATDLDNNGENDTWVEFSFTEKSLIDFANDAWNKSITGDSTLTLYAFTSTSQTANGDIAGIHDKNEDLSKSWKELGVIVTGSLNEVSNNEILKPTVTSATFSTTTPTITGTWGSDKGGTDDLTVGINGVTYTTSGTDLTVDGYTWSLIVPSALTAGQSYTVTATTTRSAESKTATNTIYIQDNDATLSGITLSNLTISPVFSSGTFSYTASASNTLNSTDLVATLNSVSSTLTVNEVTQSSSVSLTNALSFGTNSITITVLAENGLNSNTYQIDILKQIDPVVVVNDNTTREPVAEVVGSIAPAPAQSGNFSISLPEAPSSNVVITLQVSDNTEATISPNTLTFTSANYSVNQTVTVTGIDDTEGPSLRDGPISFTVTGTVSSSDPGYNNVVLSPIGFTNLDGDPPGISVELTGITISESGNSITANFSILSTLTPTAAQVDLPLTLNDGSEASFSNSSIVTSTTISFTNTQTTTSVLIYGVEDTLSDGTQSVTLVTGDPSSSGASADTGYDALVASDVADLSFNVTDNEFVSDIYTDFGNFWTSSISSISPTKPNNNHDLLGFTFGGTTYSTGVNDGVLNTYNVAFTAREFRALPINLLPNTFKNSYYVTLGNTLDGSATTVQSPTNNFPAYPSQTKLAEYLTDGVNGLNLGTGLANIPSGSRLEFNVNAIDNTNIGDGEPDFLVTQIAEPGNSKLDEFWFEDVNGNMVGNKVIIDLSLQDVLGVWRTDRFTLDGESESKLIDKDRDIRFKAFEISEFGVTSSNSASIKKLVYILSGTSDPAFIAYNVPTISLPTKLSQTAGSTTYNYNTVLSTPIKIQVKDASNNNVTQAGITITAGVQSGTATLSGTLEVITDANGVATFTDLTVNGTGDQELKFSAPGLDTATTTLSFQRITTQLSGFPDFSIPVDNPDFLLGAPTTNNIQVTFSYSISPTSVATINSSTGTVTLINKGNAVITVTQSDSAYYTSATITATMTVTGARDTGLIWSQDITKTYGDSEFVIPISTSSSTGSYTYSSTNTNIATINSSTGSITINQVGSTVLKVVQASDSYYAENFDEILLTVVKADPVYTSNTLTKTFGDDDFIIDTSVVSSTSPSSLSYSGSDINVIRISTSTVTINGAGEAIITASQPATTNYNAGTYSFTITVSKGAANLQDILDITKNYNEDEFIVTTTTSSTGDITFTSSDSSVISVTGMVQGLTSVTASLTIIGAGEAIITATQTPSNSNVSETISFTVTVNKIDPNLGGLVDLTKVYTDADFAVTATSSSSTEITYSSTSPSVATINSSTGSITITGVGTTVITATQTSSANYTSDTASYTLTVNKGDASISGFTDLTKTFGGEDFPLTGTSSNTGAISYTVSDTTVATVSGTTITIVGAGTTSITLTQASDDNYNSATATITLTVSKATPSYTVTDVTKTYDDDSFAIGSTILVSSSTGTLTFTVSDTTVATLTGTNTLNIQGAGGTVITAVQSATDNYLTGTTSFTLSVDKNNAIILSDSSSPISDISKVFSDPSFAQTATSSSTGAFTFTSSDTDVITLSTTATTTTSKTVSHTIAGAGTAIIKVSQAADANYNAATVSYTITVTKADPNLSSISDISKTYGDVNDTIVNTLSTTTAIQYTSSNPSVVQIASTEVGSDTQTATLTFTGAGTAIVTATLIETANYQSATTSFTVTVSKSAPTLSGFSDITKTYGDADFSLVQPTSNSDGGFTYASSNTASATITGDTGSISHSGAVVITATQAATANYNAGTISLTLTINKASQSISVDPLPNTIPLKDFTTIPLTATSSSGNTVGIVIDNSSAGTLSLTSGNYVLAPVGQTGIITLTFSVDATTRYNSATVTLSLDIVKTAQSISYSPALPTQVSYSGGLSITLTASATSGLGVSYIVVSGPATLSGNSLTISQTGVVFLEASQIGDAAYNPAPVDQKTITINPGSVSLSNFSIPAKVDSDPDFAVTAPTSSVPGTIVYSSSNLSVASINGSTMEIIAAGTTAITATQLAIPNKYNSASIQASFIVAVGDTDGDGILDPFDLCPNTPAGATVNSDGCAASQRDTDGDGVVDSLDNCVTTSNADQSDTDGDGVGDVCDNAPNTPNSDQADTDRDGIPDADDDDDDNDGVPDAQDDFPKDPNETTDTDGDGQGDNADTDLDNDGVLNSIDNCLSTPNADQLDTDGDGIGDACDSDVDGDGLSDADEITCGTDPLLASSKPLDTDEDGIPNCIDTDDDGDGYSDQDEITCGTDPLLANSKPLDTDGDGIPNCIDTDEDNDGVADTEDAYPSDKDEWTDTDGDGIGNNADPDDDNDGQTDADEIACGSDPQDNTSLSIDSDQDGIPDCVNTDDDNDGVLDTSDAFPLDPSEWIDTDSDGIGNNADTDDDNDGQSDYNELLCGSDPLKSTSMASDIDNDGIPDCIDEDIDGDGCINTADVFPRDPSECEDTDGDGLGDNIDIDSDNDGIPNTQDAFPLDPSESKDSDGDGIGDNADPDDNNDGFDDAKLQVSGVLTPNSSGQEATWKIINLDMYPNARVSVYNKNGQEVFSAQAYRNDWRGTYKNRADPLPASSYYYVIELNTGEKPINGWLYIAY
jgi:gliding motility-associated-like protein